MIITSKNFTIINHGRQNLDAVCMFSFELYQQGKITKDDYHSFVTALLDTKNCFDLLEHKLVENERPKRDKYDS